MDEIELTKNLKAHINSLLKDETQDDLYTLAKCLTKLSYGYIQQALIMQGSKLDSSLAQDAKFITQEILDEL
jgi:hypothetical protein